MQLVTWVDGGSGISRVDATVFAAWRRIAEQHEDVVRRGREVGRRDVARRREQLDVGERCLQEDLRRAATAWPEAHADADLGVDFFVGRIERRVRRREVFWILEE